MNTPIDDGGPAFPLVIDETTNESISGMSLRDYFAAAALQGLLSSSMYPIDQEEGKVTFEAYAKCAFHHADAMLREREKQ